MNVSIFCLDVDMGKQEEWIDFNDKHEILFAKSLTY